MRQKQQLLEAQIVEHGASNAKIMGPFLSKIHMYDLKKKNISSNKSISSAKCINVYTFRVSEVVCIEKSKE